MSLRRETQCLKEVLLAGILMISSSAGHALFEEDVHISGDQDSVRLDLDRRTFREIQNFIDQGYPDQSIYLHGVAQGLTIDDLVYLTVQADPQNREKHYKNAIDLLPSLPGWACRQGRLSADSRYAQTYTAEDLGTPVASLDEIARLYFEENRRMSPFPKWAGNKVNAVVPTIEVANYINDEFWYAIGRTDRPVNKGVMVSLYAHDNSVVVDGNLGQVRRAQEAGLEHMPVVIIYNEEFERPVSSFGDDPKMESVVDAFFSDQTQVTHVPNWKGPYADYHTLTPISELEDYIELPDKDDIPEKRWQQLVTELQAKGFDEKSVLATLYYNDAKIWVDEPDRVTAAKELGIAEVPVSYLYHSLDRLPCGVVPGDTCRDRIRRAAGIKKGQEPKSTAVPSPPPPPPSQGGNPSPS